MQDHEEPRDVGTLVVGATVLALVVALWVVAIPVVQWIHPSTRAPFQALNALFDGLAFFGIVVAILLQTRELSLQRKELRESTRAQQDSSQALTKRLDLERSLADQRAQLDQTFAKKRLTMAVFDDWYSPSIEEAKVRLQTYIANSTFLNNASLTFYTKNNPAEVAWFLRIFGYFRKWSVLAAAGEIDDDLLHKLLGYDVKWWHDNFAVHFNSSRELRADYKETVEIVFRGAFRRYHAA